MPTPLVVLLLVILYGLLALFLGAVGQAAIKAVKQVAERRATSLTGVSTEIPGLLDCEVNGKRAVDRLLKEIGRWQCDLSRLAKRAEMHSKQMNDLPKITKAKTRLQRANRVAKQIDHSAVYVEKRMGLFQILTKEIIQNYEVMIGTLDVTKTTDGRTARVLVFAFESFDTAGTAAITGITHLKQGAISFEQSNLTRMVREAGKRLDHSLDGMLSCFTQFRGNCQCLHTELLLKCPSADSLIPHRKGSQPE